MSWSAGTGGTTITPPVPVMLAGFGDRTEPARGVHDELEVRALYLRDGERAACLLVLDLLGLSADVADPIRDAVANGLGIDREAVLTSCVHTHSGPNAMTGGEKLGWVTPDGYGEALREGCLTAARAARGAVEPVTMSYVRAPLPEGLSLNRRDLPYDPWFTALEARGARGRVAVVGNVSIHPVSLGSPWLEVSSDWVGPFRAAVERAGGGTAIMLNGALGDVNPHERHTDIPAHMAEAYAEATEIGEGAAAAVVRALAGATPVDGPLRTGSRTIDVPCEGPLTELLGRTEDRVELVEWAVGDVAIVGVPGEAFHELGRAITDARGGRALLAAIAPSWHGYLPVPFRDGYEEMMSFGKRAVSMIAGALVGGPSREAVA